MMLLTFGWVTSWEVTSIYYCQNCFSFPLKNEFSEEKNLRLTMASFLLARKALFRVKKECIQSQRMNDADREPPNSPFPPILFQQTTSHYVYSFLNLIALQLRWGMNVPKGLEILEKSQKSLGFFLLGS